VHRGADGFMSAEQFERFYWPALKSGSPGPDRGGPSTLLVCLGRIQPKVIVCAMVMEEMLPPLPFWGDGGRKAAPQGEKSFPIMPKEEKYEAKDLTRFPELENEEEAKNEC